MLHLVSMICIASAMIKNDKEVLTKSITGGSRTAATSKMEHLTGNWKLEAVN